MKIIFYNAIIFFDSCRKRDLILMKLLQIKYLLQVLESGSISAAADVLGMKRTTLLMSLDALEEDLGITILQRGKASTILTPEGIQILDIIEQLNQKISQIESLRQQWMKKKEIYFYADSPILITLLNHLNNVYNASFQEETQFKLTTLTEADFIFSLTPPAEKSNDYNQYQIFCTPYFICMRNVHPLAGEDFSLLTSKQIAYPIFSFIHSDKLFDKYAYTTIDNISSLQRIILLNDYLALVPEIYLNIFSSFINQQLHFVKISDDNLTFTVHLSVRKNIKTSEVAINYLNYLFSYSKEESLC